MFITPKKPSSQNSSFDLMNSHIIYLDMIGADLGAVQYGLRI